MLSEGSTPLYVMSKNKCILSLSVKIPSHSGYRRMSPSIYFPVFLESSLGGFEHPWGWPAHQRMHAESASSQMSSVWFSTNVTAPVNKNACLTFSPLVQKNLVFGWKQRWLLCTALQPCFRCFTWHLCTETSAVIHTFFFFIHYQIFTIKMNF